MALLRDDDITVAASAAGTLQNVAREVAARLIIFDTDCVAPLAALLSSGDTTAQVRGDACACRTAHCAGDAHDK